MQLSRVAQGCPSRVSPAKIALLDFDLKKYCMRQAEILVSDPEELEKIRQKEMDITRDRINKVAYDNLLEEVRRVQLNKFLCFQEVL